MEYQVDCDVPRQRLGRADVIFKVRQDRNTVGTLEVSKGGVVWFPRDNTYGYKLTWIKFDEMMQEGGRPRAEKRNRSTRKRADEVPSPSSEQG